MDHNGAQTRNRWRKSATTLLALVGVVGTAHADAVKIMSYNVLANWDQARGDRIVAVIDDQAPDVVGLQEAVGDNVEYLAGRLGEKFSVHFTGTENPIFVRRTESLRLIDSGSTEILKCFLDRTVNWVRLEETDSGRQFIYYNTHLCFILQNTLDEHTNEEANQIQAGQIMDVMASHAEEGLIQIIGGDLNTFTSSNTTRFFLEQRPLPFNGKENPLSLKETWAAAPGNTGEKPSTRGGGAGGMGGGGMAAGGMGPSGGMAARLPAPDEPGIDWLFISAEAEIVAAEVIRNDLTEGTSDHLPISATIAF